MSLEGVAGSPFDAADSATATLTVEAPPAAVAEALATPPDFETELPAFLALGFNRPVGATGSGLDAGDHRTIEFTGGTHDDHPLRLFGLTGERSVDHHSFMHLTVTESRPGRAVFTIDHDMTMLARWADLRRAVVTWEAAGDTVTRVSWTLEYDRLLSPRSTSRRWNATAWARPPSTCWTPSSPSSSHERAPAAAAARPGCRALPAGHGRHRAGRPRPAGPPPGRGRPPGHLLGRRGAPGGQPRRRAARMVAVHGRHRHGGRRPGRAVGGVGAPVGRRPHPRDYPPRRAGHRRRGARRGRSGPDAAGGAGRRARPYLAGRRGGGGRHGAGPRAAAGLLDRDGHPPGRACAPAGRRVHRMGVLRPGVADLHCHRRVLGPAARASPLALRRRRGPARPGRRDDAPGGPGVRGARRHPGPPRPAQTPGHHRPVRLPRQPDAARRDDPAGCLGSPAGKRRRRGGRGSGRRAVRWTLRLARGTRARRPLRRCVARLPQAGPPHEPRWRPAASAPATVYVAATCDQCSEVGDFLARRRPTGLAIHPAESCPYPLRRITYHREEDGHRATGIAAISHSLERANLAWAAASWTARLPGIQQLLQLIADAVTTEPRSVDQRQSRTQASATARSRTLGASGSLPPIEDQELMSWDCKNNGVTP